MDNLAADRESLNPASHIETIDAPSAPASLSRRSARLAAPEKLAGKNAAAEVACESVDHLIIVVHGAGTSKESAEAHGRDLQVG